MSNVLFHQCKEDQTALVISVGADVADAADVENLVLALNGTQGNGVIFKVRGWDHRGEPRVRTLIHEDQQGMWTQSKIGPMGYVRSGIYLGHGYVIVTTE